MAQAQEVSIDINPLANQTADQKAKFDPATKTVRANDLVYWSNNDDTNTHQPMPVGGKPGDWVKGPITPNSPSNTVSFAPNTTTKDGVDYVCASHKDEKGTIIVLNNIDINGVPGALTTDPQAAFNPGTADNPATVNVDEAFVWTNNDINPHQPAPKEGSAAGWPANPIQPGQTSQIISFSQATSEDGLTYICTIHPDEIGVIVVQNPE